MKKCFLLYFISCLSLLLLLQHCASRVPLTGGEKDTIPPQLIQALPENKSLNFNGNEVKLVFDELIKADRIKDQLIIVPKLDQEYDYKVNKNTLSIKLEKALEENTTYNFNFRESVKDITEGNISKKLIIAFSTGNYIDSLYIEGQVVDLLTNTPLEDVTVGIYGKDDTTDIFTDVPKYFTISDKDGRFRLENIKNGLYRIYANKDGNKNLINEPDKEAFGFLSSDILLEGPESVEAVTILTQRLDIRPFDIQSIRPSGKYFEIKFNKYITDYELSTASSEKIYSNLVNSNQTIRIYNTFDIPDSLQVSLIASDTIGQKMDTSFYIKYTESKRKPEDFKVVYPKNNQPTSKDFEALISFNKPVGAINFDSIFFIYDSLNRLPVTNENIHWNKNNDELNIRKKLPKRQLDSLARAVRTKNTDTTAVNATPFTLESITLFFGKGSFLSVENDSSQRAERTYQFIKPKNYGVIRGNITTEKESFLIQLLDLQFNVIKEINHFTPNNIKKKKYTFINVGPGEYNIRVLIDNNLNGQWDFGHIKEDVEPETIYFYESPFTIRANWELEDINLIF